MIPTSRPPERDLAFVLDDPMVAEASARLRDLDGWTLERQMELTAIPAPTLREGARGERMAELFGDSGLEHVRTDEAGNVLGEAPLRSSSGGPARAGEAPLILSAHLDTIFPPGTDVTPRVQGNRVRAPGICDDGRGLAALLALARVVRETPFSLPYPVVFAATVGEEGTGNLKGVRFLFGSRGEGPEPRGFISLDGAGMDRVIHRGVGSVRFRITSRGPGGHSWMDFGRPNPIHRLAAIIARAQELPLPSESRTTLTAGRWGGGTSVNAIPEEAWVEMDLRSQLPGHLEALEKGLVRLVEEEARTGETGGQVPSGGRSPVQLDLQEIGRRPAGETDPTDPLVRAAVNATRLLGEEPRLTASSTDANLPMSLGIPAITLGAGGTGGGVHTLEEWYENRKGPEGILRALLTLHLLPRM